MRLSCVQLFNCDLCVCDLKSMFVLQSIKYIANEIFYYTIGLFGYFIPTLTSVAGSSITELSLSIYIYFFQKYYLSRLYEGTKWNTTDFLCSFQQSIRLPIPLFPPTDTALKIFQAGMKSIIFPQNLSFEFLKTLRRYCKVNASAPLSYILRVWFLFRKEETAYRSDYAGKIGYIGSTKSMF